ncbi:MAG: leucine--tRNA ligase, partial [Clostridia bacterium]|nr:leucine--tRNA ligase [Clostridia bacterium]
RFYTKFLCDIGTVDFNEPFTRLFNQGMVTKNGAKMSKSKGNVVSPDELVEKYGCDSLRMYELFIGPPELDSEWDDRGIEGVYRFLNKVWKLVDENKQTTVTKEMERLRHKMVHDITLRMESFNLNTVVSGFMEYTNKLIDLQKKEGGIDQDTIETLIILLAPFTPHISEELWEAVGGVGSVFANQWPTYDEEKMKEDEIEIAIQISGKVAGKIRVAIDEEEASVLAKAKLAAAAKLEGKVIVKEIYVKGRIVNIVAK